MARKSLLDKIISSIDIPNGLKNSNKEYYLIVYDFDMKKMNRIPEKFYINLEKIRKIFNDGYFVQKSVIISKSYKVAKIISSIAKHYGASIHIYCVKDIIE